MIMFLSQKFYIVCMYVYMWKNTPVTSHGYSVWKSRTVAEILYSDWCPVTVTGVKYSRTVAEMLYSDWRPVTVAGVKYLKIRVTRRQPQYETSVTDIWWPLYETFGHYVNDW